MNLSTRMIKATFAVVLSLFVLLASFATTPATYAAPIVVGEKAVVANTDGDTIRIREGASTDDKQVGEAHEGEIVTVTAGPKKDDEGRTWYKVQAPGGTGWMSGAYLAPYDGSKQSSKPASSSSKPKITGHARVANTDGDPLNVRSKPSRAGDIVGTLAADTVVAVKAGPVTDEENIAWYQISAGNLSGWAMAQYLAQASAPAQSSSKTASKSTPAPRKLTGFARVANTDGDNLNVRAEPNRNSKVVATLPPNTSVAVKAGPVNDKDGVAWYQISANSVTGWAMAQYLEQADAPPQAAPKAQPASSNTSQGTRSGSSRGSTPAAPSAQVESSDKGSRIVNIAMQYVGYRYRYGGSSPSGFDCSGFVYYVLNKAGVPVGRSMESQLNSGPRVSSKSLQPGDLVFFVNTYKRGLSHAGIYIGNGKFVHAENESTGVVVSALWSSYWAGHYYTAVRP